MVNKQMGRYSYVLSKDHRRVVLEHRLVYEQNHKCCLLPWGVIHHIDGVWTNNDISNLMLMSQAQHIRLHRTVDMSDRKCSHCGSDRTYKDPNGRPEWVHSKITGELVCIKCYKREYYRLPRKYNKIID